MREKADKIYFLSLYFAMVLLEVSRHYSCANIIKYVFMVSCFIWVLKFGRYTFIKYALLGTLAADYFLLFTKHFTVGTAIFCVVMCIYIYGFSAEKITVAKTAAGAAVCSLAVVIWHIAVPFVYVTYAVLFYCNLFICIKNYGHSQKLVPRAFILFALCDIFVALYNTTYISALVPFMWIFYAPSQYIISHIDKGVKE